MSWRTLGALFGITLTAGILGFGIGRASSTRHHRIPTSYRRTAPSPSYSSPAERQARPPETPADPAKAKTAPETVEAAGETQPDRLSQFLDLILPLFADDAQALRKSMFPVTLRNAEAQKAVFDLIMTTEDPSLLEGTGMFLMYAKDPKFVAQLAEAFSTESNPARRAVLATALGQNIGFAEALPAVESVLAGKDAGLQAETLKWLSVDSKKPEIFERIVPKLRTLGLSNESPEIRAAALRSLRGDASEEGTRFLIQRALHDSHVEVQKTALGSLSLSDMGMVPPIPAEQLTALWTVFGDGARDADLRVHAAQMILNATSRKLGTVTDEQRQALQALIDSRRKRDPQ
jgi:hypothetical protein